MNPPEHRTPGYEEPPSKPSAASMAFRLALPVIGILLILVAMVIVFLRPDLAGRHLYFVGAAGVLLFLTIFLTWERGNLLNFLHLGIYCALVTGSLILVYMLLVRHPASWDLTRDRIHSLSEQTSQYLGRLPQPVKVVAFTSEEERKRTEEFLDLYHRANPQLVAVEVYAVAEDKLVAQQYDTNVYPGDFFVIREAQAGAERKKKISLGSVNEYSETQITNAIIEVMRDKETKVYFITGHGEKGLTAKGVASETAHDSTLSELRRLLEERVFPCEELNLLEKGFIPDDASVVVIAGPRQDLFDLERDMLQDYLANGGRLLLLFDPVLERGVRFPNLVSLLTPYGIETSQNAVVADLAGVQEDVGPLTPIVQEFGQHKIMEGLPTVGFYLVEARALKPVESPPPGLSVVELFKTGPRAWSVDVDELMANNLRLRPPEAGLSQQTLAVAAVKAGATSENDTRLVVIGDSDVFANAVINSMTATLFYQACNWLAEQEDLLAIPPKLLTETPISLQSSDVLILSFALGLIVLLVLFGGLGYTVLRRKLG